MSELGIGERATWGDFPKVIRNGDLGSLKNEPEYQAAKAGDMPAALDLVDRLLSDDTVAAIKEQIGDSRPLLLPVLAQESGGHNKIPLAMAEVLSDRLGLDVELGILQRDRVGRTNTGADHRLAFNPTFIGEVKPGQGYLVLDDTLTMGGTVASLRGYVENRGGHVQGASVMTAHEGALDLAVKPKMLTAIHNKHGPGMDQFWQETFGYGIDKLTQGEAGHLKAAQTLDGLRDRVLGARHEGLQRMGQSRAETAQSGQSQRDAVRGQDTGESLLAEAVGAETQQQSTLEAATLDQSYQETLVTFVEAKHAQIDRIENRLESLIDRQEAKLQQNQASRPGFLSRPSTRAAWQANNDKSRARLQTLHTRLEAVKEIKEGMGLTSPRVDELATRKMRAENPELASDWDAMREAERRQQALAKKEQQSRKRVQGQSRGASLGLGRSRD